MGAYLECGAQWCEVRLVSLLISSKAPFAALLRDGDCDWQEDGSRNSSSVFQGISVQGVTIIYGRYGTRSTEWQAGGQCFLRISKAV